MGTLLSRLARPFLAAGARRWVSYPALDDLLGWSGSGIMPGRTWVVAPDKPTLKRRWEVLIKAKQADKPELLTEHPTDRRVDTVLSDGLPGFPTNKTPIGQETGACPNPSGSATGHLTGSGSFPTSD